MLDVTKVDLTKVYDLSKKIIDYYKYLLEDKKINASGKLSKTADFDVDYNEYGLAIYFILESYYWYVEQGRNGSTGKFGVWLNKYKDIENWLRQKISRGWFIPTSGHTIPRTDKEIKKVTGAIVHKITHVGFYGRDHHGLHPLKEAIEIADREGIIDEIIDTIVTGFAGTVEAEIEKIW